jgi:hypothetical protein
MGRKEEDEPKLKIANCRIQIRKAAKIAGQARLEAWGAGREE